MKKLNFILNAAFIIAILAFVAGCANSTTAEKTTTETKVDVKYHQEIADGAEKYVAKLAIEGMSCEMMCGGKIASTLEKINGVKKVDIDFTDIDEESYAVVEYDSSLVSEQDMVNGVHGIADGIYQVKSVDVTHFKSESASTEVKEKTTVSYTPQVRYKLPNIFSALVSLF